MKLNYDKFKKIHGYEEGGADTIDPESLARVLDYKRYFLSEFIAINPFQIDSRLGSGNLYYVTRKYNGEFAAIVFENNETVTINRSGRVRRGIPCIEEAGKLLAAAGIKQAVIPAEIYVYDGKKRTRVNDLLSALADKKKISMLRLAAFDLLELNHKPYDSIDYHKMHDMLAKIFSGGEMCHPVDMKTTHSIDGVKEIYAAWVENEGSEGLVVRSLLPLVFKIKPRHSIDAVVVGFSEGPGDQKGQLRSLLVALMPEEGKYQIIGRVGGGFSEKLKKSMFIRFTEKIIDSDFIETDTNFVAYQMVEPDTVIEISVNDLLYETTAGPKLNPVLTIFNGHYLFEANVEGFKMLAPGFERFRDDKKASPEDVRVSQIDDFSYLERERKAIPEPVTPHKSKLLLREVYRKESGSKIMVQKFLVWKTNKEKSGDFPAYVFYCTKFSSERAEPLQREVNISDSYDQIMSLQKNARETNIKKGWIEVGEKTEKK